MSVVNLAALNPHCASGYMRSTCNCDLLRTIRAQALPHDAKKANPAVIVIITAIPLFLYALIIFASLLC